MSGFDVPGGCPPHTLPPEAEEAEEAEEVADWVARQVLQVVGIHLRASWDYRNGLRILFRTHPASGQQHRDR